MKKIFLPLLALVGMVTGFTLTSCGGGGGSEDEIIQLTGLSIEAPAGLGGFEMEVQDRVSPNVYVATYNDEMGRFQVLSLNDKTVRGQMWFEDVDSASDLAHWFGFSAAAGREISSEAGKPVILELEFENENGGMMSREGTVVLWNDATRVVTIDLKTGEVVDTTPGDEDEAEGEAAIKDTAKTAFTVTASCKGVKDMF
ncbi:MAG: hypothetical protein IJE88_08460 [Akkermansia sp.]|nr:hypothetical protein [Akkermansia sp.]